MTVRLAVFDLDNTLITTGSRISERTAAQLAALVSDGLPVALASARLDESLQVVQGAIGVPLARISYNGALTRLADGNVAHEVGFEVTDELADALARFTQPAGHGGTIDVYTSEGSWLAFGRDEAISREERDTWCTATRRQPAAEADELAGLRCRKILVEGDDELVAPLYDVVAGMPEVNLTHSGMGLHDIWPVTSGKGNALAALCHALGTSPAEVLACGDSDTDVPMLRLAGTSIGVQPCAPAVRECATELVTGPGSDELFATVRRLAGLAPWDGTRHDDTGATMEPSGPSGPARG